MNFKGFCVAVFGVATIVAGGLMVMSHLIDAGSAWFMGAAGAALVTLATRQPRVFWPKEDQARAGRNLDESGPNRAP